MIKKIKNKKAYNERLHSFPVGTPVFSFPPNVRCVPLGIAGYFIWEAGAQAHSRPGRQHAGYFAPGSSSWAVGNQGSFFQAGHGQPKPAQPFSQSSYHTLSLSVITSLPYSGLLTHSDSMSSCCIFSFAFLPGSLKGFSLNTPGTPSFYTALHPSDLAAELGQLSGHLPVC